MEYRDWEILKVLHREKNLTKAAKLLFITQPALTNRLKHMQEELGTTIVTRESRGIHFTPQGEYLAHCAEEALAHYQKIKENLLHMGSTKDNEVAGILKLGVSNFFANYKLAHILKLFKQQYPHVEFKVITGWSKDVSQLVHNNEVHIGFVRGDYSCRRLLKHQLFEETICVTSKEEIVIADLPHLPRIDYRGDYLLKSAVDNWWAENFTFGICQYRSRPSGYLQRKFENGLGYGILSIRTHNGIEDLYKIDLIDNKGNPILRRTWIYYHERSLELNVVKAFVQFVKDLDWKNM